MKRSLRNLLRNLTGHGPARTASRPAPNVRPQIEGLEQRLVPTVNLSGKEIGFGAGVGVLFVQNETINGGTATFSGGFEDASGHWIPVNGQLTQMGSWDKMTFQGGITNFVTSENVNFNGWVNEASLNQILGGTYAEGTLTEDYSWLISLWPSVRFGHSTTSESVGGYAQYIPQ
jgi:hypothetical protein